MEEAWGGPLDEDGVGVTEVIGEDEDGALGREVFLVTSEHGGGEGGEEDPHEDTNSGEEESEALGVLVLGSGSRLG